MKQTLLYLLPFLLIFSGCEKKNKLERSIEGRMYNAVTGEPVIGGFVTLSAHIYKNGIYNTNLTELASVRTGINGKFTIEFERQNTEEYILDVSDPNVYDKRLTISTDNMYSGNPYNFDVPVYAKSEVLVHIKNNSAKPESDDRIQYGYKGDPLPCSCCTNEAKVFTGATIDTTFGCAALGGKYFVYNYSVFHSGQPVKYVKDSILCEPKKVNYIDIFFE